MVSASCCSYGFMYWQE